MLHQIHRVQSYKKNRSTRVRRSKIENNNSTKNSRLSKSEVYERILADLEIHKAKTKPQISENLLTQNTDVHKKDLWKCVGKIRAAMKLCSVCFDDGKKRNKEEFYFVNEIEKKSSRTILCSVCMNYLKKYFAKTNNNV